jgi:integrase/recombinase XerD
MDNTQIVPADDKKIFAGIPSPDFLVLVEMVGRTVSARSAKAYSHDLAEWGSWALANGHDPTMPTFASVSAYILFLDETDVSRATIKRRVSAVRKLAQVAAVIDFENPKRRAALESLSLLRIDAGHKQKREKKALTPAQADRALRAWDGDSNRERRNKAIVTLMFCTGARRSEIANLRWADVDLVAGVIHILSGKGDKERYSPIAGEVAIEALKEWKEIGGTGEYVFCAINKGDNLGEDVPISDQAIYDVIRETGQRTGEPFTPHDARRTFITEALATGTPLAEVQANVGHARGDTTLAYAQPGEAAGRRINLRLRYG